VRIEDYNVQVLVNGDHVPTIRVVYDQRGKLTIIDIDYAVELRLAQHLDRLPTLSQVVRQWTESK